MATAKRDLTNPPVQGPPQPLLLPAEAAEFLRVSLDQLYHLTSRKQVPFVKVGGALRFDRRRLEEFVAAGPTAESQAESGRNGTRKVATRGSKAIEPARGRDLRQFVFKTPPRPSRAQ